MIKALLGNLAYGVLRQQAPLFFLFVDVANAFIDRDAEVEVTKTKEPEGVTLAKKFFGISKVENFEQIKKRYKELANIHHPDKDSGSEEKMKLLNMHYENLVKYYTKN